MKLCSELISELAVGQVGLWVREVYASTVHIDRHTTLFKLCWEDVISHLKKHISSWDFSEKNNEIHSKSDKNVQKSKIFWTFWIKMGLLSK